MTEPVDEDRRDDGGQPRPALRMIGESDAAACTGDSCDIPPAPAHAT